MIIDLSSFSFGSNLRKGTGTPSWGTQLGQQKPDYKLIKPNCHDLNDIIIGLVYNSIPLDRVNIPIVKGGSMVNGLEDNGIQIASVFNKVYVNGRKIEHPFAMVLYKESSVSHFGRRTLKYSPKIYHKDDNGIMLSNNNFIYSVKKEFNLSNNACWFVYEIIVKEQDELHMSAIFVNKSGPEYYRDSHERKEIWKSLIDSNK
jgi:hypothetical protein